MLVVHKKKKTKQTKQLIRRYSLWSSIFFFCKPPSTCMFHIIIISKKTCVALKIEKRLHQETVSSTWLRQIQCSALIVRKNCQLKVIHTSFPDFINKNRNLGTAGWIPAISIWSRSVLTSQTAVGNQDYNLTQSTMYM